VETPDLAKIRRFAIGAALALLGYSVLGVEIQDSTGPAVFGLTFKIGNSDSLPFILLIVAFYSSWRYYFYAFMAASSPFRKRRQLIQDLVPLGHPLEGEILRFNHFVWRSPFGVYVGARRFQATSDPRFTSNANPTHSQKLLLSLPHVSQREWAYNGPQPAKKLADSFVNIYPNFWRSSVKTEILESEGGYTGADGWRVEVTIPWPCRLAAFLQDLDYALPLLMCLFATAWTVWP